MSTRSSKGKSESEEKDLVFVILTEGEEVEKMELAEGIPSPRESGEGVVGSGVEIARGAEAEEAEAEEAEEGGDGCSCGGLPVEEETWSNDSVVKLLRWSLPLQSAGPFGELAKVFNQSLN